MTGIGSALTLLVLSGEGWKTLTVGHCLKVISTIQKKTVARHFCNLAPRLYNSYNHTMCQVRTCGRVWALGLTPSAPKQWKSNVYVKSQNNVSARSPLTKSKKKLIIESAAI